MTSPETAAQSAAATRPNPPRLSSTCPIAIPGNFCQRIATAGLRSHVSTAGWHNAQLPGPRVSRALELNHCSTTRDGNAPSAAHRSLCSQVRDLPKQGPQPTHATWGAVSQTAPPAHETRPYGLGLTCEFGGGRCWVRTNVG
jgi:hypothetical protein